jgi:hypothetical protein
MVTRRTDAPMERSTRLLLAGGVVGPLLFIVVFLIEGATLPGYSVWRNQVSDLELSNQGWEPDRQLPRLWVAVHRPGGGTAAHLAHGEGFGLGAAADRPVRAGPRGSRGVSDRPRQGVSARCSPQGRPADLARVGVPDAISRVGTLGSSNV